MNRPVSSLFAIASAAAALLAVVPAAAQATYFNNFESTGNPGIISTETSSATGTAVQAYTPATQATAGRTNYVKESGTTAGTNTNPLFLNEGSSQGASYDYTSGANYTALVSNVASTGTAINGEGTFISGQTPSTPPAAQTSTYNPTTATYQSTVQAFDGTQSEMVSFIQNNTATTSFYRLQTVSTSSGLDALSRPTIDLGGTVSFMVYFDTGLGTGTSFASPNTTPLAAGTSTLGVEIATNQTSASTTLGAYGGTSQASVYVLGSTNTAGTGGTPGAAGTGSGTFPTGGHSVTNGSWQLVTFNLPTESSVLLLGTAAQAKSGFGILNDIDFTTSGVAGQSFNIYIDDLTITGAPAAAPEPSAWAAMGIGAFALLALGLRARRRSAGQMAC